MDIGFIGLGQMGRHVAVNLCRDSDRVVAFARQPEIARLRPMGDIRVSGELGDLGRSDVVFLCLPDAAAVRSVLLGDGGLLPLLRTDAIVVDLSTIDHVTTLALAQALAARGVSFVDAPISGMEARARDGTLTIMCGGDDAIVMRLRPLLERVGTTIVPMGPVGSGQLAKLVNQLLFDINMAALAEILPLAAKLGLDPAAIGKVVNGGTGRSYASEFFIPRVLRGNFSDGYPLAAAYKDLVAAAELASRLCVPLPVLAAATVTYQRALLAGHGGLDKGAMILPAEAELGLSFRSDAEGAVA